MKLTLTSCKNYKYYAVRVVCIGTLLIALTLSVVTTLNPGIRVHAQLSEPTAIIDAAFHDLSAKLGRTLTRSNTVNFTWELDNFPDSSLGCPQSGQTYTQSVTHGYKITILVQDTATTYDYRASLDGTVLFQCAAGIPVAATAVATAAAANNVPVIYTHPIAYVGTDGNVYVTGAAGQVGTPITADAHGGSIAYFPYFENKHLYGLLRWSPDGATLAFTDIMTATLFIAHSGQSPSALASGLTLGYPPAWSADGSEISYAISTRQSTTINGQNAEISQIQASPVSGGQPRVAGQFASGVGCGGGGFDPAEATFMNEVGYEGNRVTLAQVGQNFLYTSTCTGLGLGLTTPNNQGTWLRTDLANAALSPDRTQLFALRRDKRSPILHAGTLEKVDLVTGKGTDIPTQPNPDQIGWSQDGSTILYSTLVPSTTISANANNPLGSQLLTMWPPTNVQLYTISLWSMPATGGKSTQLFSQEGRGVGLIVPLDSANALISVVPSLNGMIQQLNAGKSAAEIKAAAPFPQLWTVSLDGQHSASVGHGGQPAVSAGTFSAMPAAIPPTNTASTIGSNSNPGTNPTPNSGSPVPVSVTPPALVITHQAIVSITSGTLNLRQTPGLTAPVLRLLKSGAMVTILAGPQTVDGLRWWQIRTAEGLSGWVVDQITDSTGTTNTLTPTSG